MTSPSSAERARHLQLGRERFFGDEGVVPGGLERILEAREQVRAIMAHR